MQFVSSWVTPDRGLMLDLSEPVLKVFEKHVQQRPNDAEAGGLLLGTVHGENILVTEATQPTWADKRFRFLFERLPFGHRATAEHRWRESGGTVRYLGEWHTHPQDRPAPSHIDRVEWEKLAVKRLDQRPMLAIIVGRCDLHVELVPSGGCGVVLRELTPTVRPVSHCLGKAQP